MLLEARLGTVDPRIIKVHLRCLSKMVCKAAYAVFAALVVLCIPNN